MDEGLVEGGPRSSSRVTSPLAARMARRISFEIVYSITLFWVLHTVVVDSSSPPPHDPTSAPPAQRCLDTSQSSPIKASRTGLRATRSPGNTTTTLFSSPAPLLLFFSFHPQTLLFLFLFLSLSFQSFVFAILSVFSALQTFVCVLSLKPTNLTLIFTFLHCCCRADLC